MARRKKTPPPPKIAQDDFDGLLAEACARPDLYDDPEAAIRQLLEAGAHPDGPGGGPRHGPLHVAAEVGNAAALKALIGSADLFATTAHGETAWLLAAARGRSDAMLLLGEAMRERARLDPSKAGWELATGHSGQSAVFLAASAPSAPCVELALAFGADPNRLNDSGASPFWAALVSGAERGADIETVARLRKCTHPKVWRQAIEEAFSPSALRVSYAWIQDVLRMDPAAASRLDGFGRTPFTHALERLDEQLASLILPFVDPWAPAPDGRIPLLILCAAAAERGEKFAFPFWKTATPLLAAMSRAPAPAGALEQLPRCVELASAFHGSDPASIHGAAALRAVVEVAELGAAAGPALSGAPPRRMAL